MSIQVGEVISVSGVKVTIRVFEESSKDILFYEGDKYKGISIREHVLIRRGFKDIVCIIEGEYLDERKFDINNGQIEYIRKVDAKPIGHFEGENFLEGIKFLPSIKDPVHLIPERQIAAIYGSKEGDDQSFIIGKMLREGLPVSLPWERLFNTHLGIFGNTGSGKSNTLTKLYTTLLSNKASSINGKSHFVVIDFNGEYTKNQLAESGYKEVIDLSTRDDSGGRFPLINSEFWNSETLAMLFKATANTQRPFIDRVVNGRNRYNSSPESLRNYICFTFERSFTSTNQKREVPELLKVVAKTCKNEALVRKLNELEWHGAQGQQKFILTSHPGANVYLDGSLEKYNAVFWEAINTLYLEEIDPFDELIIRINLQLTNDLLHGYVQFEHIQPLLKRVQSSVVSLRKIINVSSDVETKKVLTVVSLRKCNQETKKIVPLLIAKHYYESRKQKVTNPPDKTLHLIIDEAHNILSEQSVREQESWKDYRLELFEEIIKEGRKFGVYLTLSSQRPADISATIMSQIHNFFIHRLVNDKDLFLLDNTISTLDSLSKRMIPSLAKGCCIVTGSSFDLPLLIQVDLLKTDDQPDSDDVNLENLWA